jgi:Ser/Thr protein kinase RdoA (MazF antagonist)
VHAVIDPLERAWGREVARGLKRFTEPPDWLLAVDDPERVAAALVRWVPELSSGRLRLRDCEVERMRLKDGAWAGQYRLVVWDSAGEREVALDARVVADGSDSLAPGVNREPFAAGSWRCYAPELALEFRARPPDAVLASLPTLTDPRKARALLERGMRSASPRYADIRILSCTPTVMRYKPGSRCTVLYRLEYPPEGAAQGWPNPVIAKTHHGSKGRTAHASMIALWASPLRASDNVTVAEPLGFLAEDNVLLQGPVPGERTLKQQLRTSLTAGTPAEIDALRAHLEQTARGLADLHGCGVSVGESWTFSDELAEVRARAEHLADHEPRLSGAATPVLDLLEAAAAAHPGDPLVPSHRSFRPAQILLHGRDVGFIDFDTFCRAEPALDLSLFFATLRDRGLRTLQARDGQPAPDEPASGEHLDLLDDLCEAFLSAYERSCSTPVSRARVDLWHALLVFDRVVTCWTKDRFERLQHCVSLLAHLYRKAGLTALLG